MSDDRTYKATIAYNKGLAAPLSFVEPKSPDMPAIMLPDGNQTSCVVVRVVDGLGCGDFIALQLVDPILGSTAALLTPHTAYLLAEILADALLILIPAQGGQTAAAHMGETLQ